MLKSRKHVFWEALLVTILIFLIGIFFGMLIETGNSNKINNLYLRSEISLTDATAGLKLMENANLSCESLKTNNINFANQIYEEAKLLEKYESSEKLTEGMKLLHKKYDLLRTILWMSNQESLSKCDNYNLIVYLYEYETERIDKKATQKVWSKILLDIKRERDDILLIPIAADQNLTSLNLLIDQYKITEFPAIVINNNEVLYTVEDTATIQPLLN
jgi:hypothetical protein